MNKINFPTVTVQAKDIPCATPFMGTIFGCSGLFEVFYDSNIHPAVRLLEFRQGRPEHLSVIDGDSVVSHYQPVTTTMTVEVKA